METHLIHQRETQEETESFLQENIEGFENSCKFLLKKMLSGERLSAKTVMVKYGIHDRRLRDLEIAGRCQKEWMYRENGKRSHVEYFIPIPKPITKTELIEKTNIAIEKLKTAERTLITLFELPDDPVSKPTYVAQTLFP